MQPLLQWKSPKYYVLRVCFLALRVQHAMLMCRIVICDLHSSTEFSTLSYKQHDFLKTIIKYEVCVLIFYTTFVWNISKKNWRILQICILVFLYM